jgi:ubiquinone/menaquinone biosynthesis C-methylase UbiE
MDKSSWFLPMNSTNNSTAAYAALAHVYDLQHGTFTPDVDMYQRFAELCRSELGPQAAVLEIGCGTGRVMIPLVEAGHRVVGVDESSEMLRIARDRLSRFPAERWAVLEQDARALEWPERFGMAFVAINTFLHNLSRENQLGMLTAARRHLLPGGRLIVDLPPNDELSYQPEDGQFEFEATLVDPETSAIIDKFVASRVFWAEQLQQLSYRLVEKGPQGTRTQTVTFHLRHVFKHEMELLLLHAGFGSWVWYGDYDLSDYADGSPRMIVVAA